MDREHWYKIALTILEDEGLLNRFEQAAALAKALEEAFDDGYARAESQLGLTHFVDR